MWGVWRPIALPDPDKALGTWAEEEEAGGFMAGSLPAEHAHVDGGDTPPVDTGAHGAQSYPGTS